MNIFAETLSSSSNLFSTNLLNYQKKYFLQESVFARYWAFTEFIYYWFNGLLEVCGWLKGHSGVSWLSGIMAVFWLYDQGAKDLSQGIIPSVVNEVFIIGEVLVLIWLDFICIVYNFYNIFTNHTFNTSSRSSCDQLSFRSSDLHRFT